MTAMWPLPLLSTPPSLPAGRCKRVTDVGMRRAAKCSGLRVQSWMLISISSISCSNTDLSHSRASSRAALYLPCTLTRLPLGEQGQIVRCLCGSRLQSALGHVGQDILALACQVLLVTMKWGKGWGGRGWVNDVKTTMVICLNAGWWRWLVASWCWGWLMLACASIRSPAMWNLLCHCGESAHSQKPWSVASVVMCFWENGRLWGRVGHGRTKSVRTEGPVLARSNHDYPRIDNKVCGNIKLCFRVM